MERESEFHKDIISTLETFKKTPCQILKSGYSQNQEIFYICICDPDQKEPICKECIDNCHKGHKVINTFEGDAHCHCGLKLHIKNNSESDKINNQEDCVFSDWMLKSKIDVVYQDEKSGKNYCFYCAYICCKKTNTHKNIKKITREENSAEIDTFFCQCDHTDHKKILNTLINIGSLFHDDSELNSQKKNLKKNSILSPSHHLNEKKNKDTKYSVNSFIFSSDVQLGNTQADNIFQSKKADYLFSKEGEFSSYSNFIVDRKAIKDLFLKKFFVNFECEGLSYNHIANLILNSEKSYKNYFENLNFYIQKLLDDENELTEKPGFTSFMLGLTCLRNIAERIMNINYLQFSSMEENIFSEAFIFNILNKKFEHSNINLWQMNNNLLYIFFKFEFKKDFQNLPEVQIYHFLNLHPLQQLTFFSNLNLESNGFGHLKNKYFSDNNFVNKIFKILRTINEIKEINIHKLEIIRTSLRILYLINKWRNFDKGLIMNFCRLADEIIFKIYNHNRNSSLLKNTENDSKNNCLISLQAKIATKIIKILIFFIINFNNDIIYKKLKSPEKVVINTNTNKNKQFFFCGNEEIAKIINKTIINIVNLCRSLVNYPLHEFKRLYNYILKINTLSYQYPDDYMISLRRILDKNKEIYLDLIDYKLQEPTENLNDNEVDFINLITQQTKNFEEFFQNYYSFDNTYQEFMSNFYSELKKFVDKFDLEKFTIPEVVFNFENFEFENHELGLYKDIINFVEYKTDNKIPKIFEKKVSLLVENDIFNNDVNQNKKKEKWKIFFKYKIHMNKSFFVQTIIKGMKIIVLKEVNKSKSINVNINKFIFTNIFRIIYFYIHLNYDNCFMVLNSEFFSLIKYTDLENTDLFLNLLTYILVSLRNHKCEIACSKEIIKICKIINRKFLLNSENLNLMLKLINIFKLLTEFDYLDQSYVFDKLRKMLREFYSSSKILKDFKSKLMILTKTLNDSNSNLGDSEINNQFNLSAEQKSIFNSIIVNKNNFHTNITNKNIIVDILSDNIKKNKVNDINLATIQKFNSIPEKNGSKFNEKMPKLNLDGNVPLKNSKNLNSNFINCTVADGSDFQQTLIIYTIYLKLLNYIFDYNATADKENFLCAVLSQNEIRQILNKKDLNLKLRLEILTFFRMVYVDVSLDKSKLKQYKSEIINPLEDKDRENLDDFKRFDFFNNIFNINKNQTNLQFQSKIIKFELKNYMEILNSLEIKRRKEKSTLEYFQNGILIPLYTFLNKFMSIICELKGVEYLNLYEIVIYFLKMKKFLVESDYQNLHTEPKKGKLLKNLILTSKSKKNLFKDIDKEKTIQKINSDLEILNKKDFEIFNYKILFNFFLSHYEEFVTTNDNKSIMHFFLKEENSYIESKFTKIKKRMKKLEMLQNNFEQNTLHLILSYENEKKNFSETAFIKCLDEHNLDFNTNYRQMITRSLVFSLGENTMNDVFKKITLINFLKLLQFETVPVQKTVLQMYEKNESSVNFIYLIDLFFENFMSVVFASSNPSAFSWNEDYFLCMVIVKILKYLCEEHNKDFQKIFFQKVKIDYFNREALKENMKSVEDKNFNRKNSNIINDEEFQIDLKKTDEVDYNPTTENQNLFNENMQISANNKVTLFEYLLCILGKILLISKWDKMSFDGLSQAGESTHFFSDIFSAIIEFLIEMIQGTDEQNLASICLETRGENKQFFAFLNTAKNLVYHDDHNFAVVNDSRRNLVEFLIAFLEEKSTPKKLAQTIAAVFNPYTICETILRIMKKLFVTMNPKYESKQNDMLKLHNWLFFNKDLRDFFKTTFFNDIDFLKKEEFELANRMFQLVKLLASKYNNVDANKLLSKENREHIEKKHQEKLQKIRKELNQNHIKSNTNSLFNEFTQKFANNNSNQNVKNNKFSNDINRNFIPLTNAENPNSENKNKEFEQFLSEDKYFHNYKMERTNDILEYEIMNMIEFFECITRQVYVQNEKDETFVLFTLNPTIPYLSKGTIEDFYSNVNRDSRYTKLYSLMEHCEYFQMEIKYNYARSKKDLFFVLINKINFKLCELLLFLILMLINLTMLFNYKSEFLNEKQPMDELVIFVGILNTILNGLVLFAWIYTKFSLYNMIETKKFMSKNNLNSEKEIKSYQKYFVIPIINAVFLRNEVNVFIWNLIFSSIAVSQYRLHYLFCLQTIIFINLSVTLKNLIKAILLKSKQLLACSFALIIVNYFFSAIAFYFMEYDYISTLQNNQENQCGSFYYCFLTNLNYGIRTDGGIGNRLIPVGYVKKENYEELGYYLFRYFFEVLFFIFLILILLNIVFGIIIDTFAELSEDQHEIDHDKYDKCFICGGEKSNLQRMSINFKKHTTEDHSIWAYVDYIITLSYFDAQDVNAINSYVIEMITDKKISWFPAEKISEDTEE